MTVAPGRRNTPQCSPRRRPDARQRSDDTARKPGSPRSLQGERTKGAPATGERSGEEALEASRQPGPASWRSEQTRCRSPRRLLPLRCVSQESPSEPWNHRVAGATDSHPPCLPPRDLGGRFIDSDRTERRVGPAANARPERGSPRPPSMGVRAVSPRQDREDRRRAVGFANANGLEPTTELSLAACSWLSRTEHTE